ncbi:MAG: recombinase family protein [Bifidobacteriaceae bacterium]|jgi:DNA invertase Pin-like site-specific DNA recombinase|nr:recombinase family protein [Bifidobacteriaceae bacterium]
MGELIGYARVSTIDQDPALQVDALERAGCSRIWVEQASGKLASRPKLAEALAALRAGDTLTVWKLDRLGRSLADLVATVAAIEEAGAGLRSLTDQIDTATAAGRMVFGVFASLAEFESDLIRERTMAGLAAARARGRKGGRPVAMTPERIRLAAQLLADGASVAQCARTLGVSRASVYRHVDAANTIGLDKHQTEGNR